VNGEKQLVSGRYVVKGKQVGFEIGDYDRSCGLVIDPVLNYSARLMPGDRIAVDGQGSAYIIAIARREVFPSVKGEEDALVVKLNPAGTQVVYTTILGGSLADRAADIAVDAEGNVTLLVNSQSPDLPGLIRNFDLGAIRKSDDGAENFQSSARGIFGSSVASEFVFDPTQPGTLYVSIAGNELSLYKSADGGGSWEMIGQSLGTIVPLAVVPGNPSTLYVATRMGLMSSADGGATWKETGLKQPNVRSLCYDPRNLMTLYAAAGLGIYKSTDGGLNWTLLQNGLPASFLPLNLAIDQSNPNALYVRLVDISNQQGGPHIYRSVNGGANWSFAAGSPDRYIPERYVTSLAVDPRNSTLYFGTYRGLFKTTDGGQTIQPLGLTDLHLGSIAIDPTNSATIYVSTPGICCEGTPTRPFGGIQKTTDGGANWTRLNNSLKDRFVGAIGIDPWAPIRLFASTGSDFSASSGVYALRLSADGARAVFSALVATGEGRALARDAADNLYLTGGGQLLTLRNALQTAGGAGFVTKLNGRTREVEYSTYLAARPRDLAVDRTGMIAIAGDSVGSETDALVKNGFQPSSKGGQEAFICRIDPQRAGADSLLFGSYLGGQGDEFVKAVAVDANGMIYATGRAPSPDFPTTPSTQITATGDDFLVKVDPAKSGASSLLWATRLGAVSVSSLAVDGAGNAYLAGTTTGGLFITPGALQSVFAGGSCPTFACNCPLVMGACPARCFTQIPGTCSDAFIAKISADGSAALYSTYFGSAADQTSEAANDLALDRAGNVYLTGYGKLPATAGAVQLDGGNGFLAKLTLDPRSAALAAVSAASFAGPQLAPESLAVGFLDAFGQGADRLGVKVRDSAGMEREATVLFSGAGQVNFQIPPGTTAGPATVRVLSGGAAIANGAVIANGAAQIAAVAPGVFGMNANGRGVAAAVAQRVKADGSQTYETIARYDQSLRQFVAIPIDLGPESDQVFLALFGTGWRFRSSEAAVKVTVGGIDAPVTYAGLQPTLVGVDQINARLPRSLAGKDEADLVVTVDGKTANTVRVHIK
jgi:uncharacterized protein (TIGR03437 family)